MMRKEIIILILVCSFLESFANRDTTLAEGDTLQSTETLALPLYSDHIVVFEDNKIRLDSQTFFNHMNQMEFEIPMDYNDQVHKYINYFATKWQPRLKEMITLKEYYFPVYESILDQYQLPIEIKYLSVIESALNQKAVSVSGAVGLWQFMPYTGKIYGLQINSYVDERKSIEKATHAACHYFTDMKEQFDDWLIVLASYNCGPGNIRKAIRRSGGKKTFWEIYPYLPKQTRNYVPKYIAMSYMLNFYGHYGISPVEISTPNDLSTIHCSSNYSIDAIAKILNMDKSEILKLNPVLRTSRLPRKGEIALNLPTNKCLLFYERKAEILKLSEEMKPVVTEFKYTVRRGESLPVIARKNNCSVRELKDWNQLRGSMIHPGQKLIIIQ
jgi:membrane-bound lytic murein transglycosylase D